MPSRPTTGAELRLIIRLLQEDQEEGEVKALLQSEPDWELLSQQAEKHRVVPLVLKKLKSDYSVLVDERILDTLQRRYREIARFNLARTAQLISLFGEFHKQNLPVLTYKGIALAQFAYGDTTLRQFTDIDLLIRKEDFLAAKKLFQNAGARPVWKLTEEQEQAVLKYYYEYPFSFGKTNTLVELHWEFLESFFAFDLDMQGVWSRSLTTELHGREITTLSAEDCLVVLCTHGSKHFWYRLSWICDVARVLDNTAIDWRLVKELGGSTGSLRMIWLGLYLARDLLNTELPDEMSEQIANDPEVPHLGEKIKNFLFGREQQPTDWTAIARLHLRMREDPTAKLKYAGRLLTTKLVDKLFMPMGRPR